jgi:hypothetical protein
MSLTRRNFLRAMMLTSGAAAFGGVSMEAIGRLAASPLEPNQPDFRRRFIFCYFNGGWDILLGADPRDPRVFTSELRGVNQVEPAYDRLPAAFSNGGTESNGLYYDADRGIALGPAAGPVWNHRDKMCVVRGLSMGTVTHEVGRRYFLTGRMPSGLTARGSSIPTEIAAQLHGQGAPANMPFVPNLAYAVESYNDRHPSFASGLKISSVEDLLDALRRPDMGYSDAEERLIADYLHRPESFGLPTARMPEALNRARRSEIQAEAVLAAQLDQRLRFPQGTNLNSPQAIGMLAVQAITQQICTTVSINVTSGLDTHFDDWAIDQPTRQQSGFGVIAQVIDSLQNTAYPDGSGDSWLDYTTIVAFSEFSRTPLINTREGRDHHPVNACMMWGAGVPHGKVIGASTPRGMLTQAVDLQTGQVDPTGYVLRPEDILGTVMANAGLEASFLARDVRYVPALEPRR